MRFSIILPIYKVESYLNRCIESIVNQLGNHEMEIILVDDGSPDKCPQICDEWGLKDSRIKVIHKQNEGLGLTRNAGMKIATGEYIAFIDSDDFIELDYLEKIENQIIRYGYPDVCLFGYNYVQRNGSISKHYNFAEGVFNKEKIVTELLPRAFSISLRKSIDTYGIGSAWGGVYKKSFLEENDLCFKSEREVLSEDLIFSIKLCSVANNIVFINDCLYNYCENAQSLSHSYRKDRFIKSVYLFEYMQEMLPKHLYSNDVRIRIFDNYLINIIVCLKQEIHRDAKLRDRLMEIKKIIDHKITRDCLSNYPVSQLPASLRFLLIAFKFRLKIIVYFLVWIKEKI